MREWIELELELLTPAFVSGAVQKTTELRAASVRGLLRWWWRASVGGANTAPAQLLQEEARIFGSAQQGVKSQVVVEVRAGKLQEINRGRSLRPSGIRFTYRAGTGEGTADILPYLAYGPVRPLNRDEKRADGSAVDPAFNGPDGKALRGPVLIRPALDRGSSFTVRLSWPPGALEQPQIQQLVRAACAWVTLGGIGARSRKGFGQLEKKSLRGSSPALDQNAKNWWSQARQEWLRDGAALGSSLPPFPQLHYRKIFLTRPPNPDWPSVLGCVGMFYKETILPALKGSTVPWLRGSASPRRASSILLSVVREDGNNLRGLVCVLPCARDNQSPAPAQLDAVKKFLAQVGATRLDCSRWTGPRR
jgi:hypothetical protein